MFKRVLVALCCAAVLALAGCSTAETVDANITAPIKEMGLDTKGATLISSREDTTSTYVCLTFDDQSCRTSIEELGTWSNLPYTPDQMVTIYDTLRDENGAPLFPLIKDGYYYFEEKTGEDGSSQGFVVAVYGFMANVLHYCEYRG